MTPRVPSAGALLLVACAAPPTIAPPAPALANPPPLVAPPPPAPAAATAYPAEEAVRDALASRLELVGMGGWYGYYRRLSCIYRNDRVLVVDVRCTPHESNLFEVAVLSPSRGRAAIGIGTPEKTTVTSHERAGYATFTVTGSAPWVAAPPLALTMSYDQIDAFEEDRGRKFQPDCALTVARPQGICSHGAPFSVAEFAAVNGAFFQAPPPELYQLVRALVAERPRSYAAADLGKMGPGQIRAWGASLGRDAQIDVAEESLPLVGNRDARFAAIVSTDDGGIAYVGTRGNVGPVVARTNTHGAKVWETVLAEPGYVETEETCMIAAPDGFIAHIHAYLDPGTKARHRFVKLDAKGRVRWKWFARNRDAIKVPQVDGAQLLPNGDVLVTGHIQLEHDGAVHDWTAEISPEGKTLRDEIGPVQALLPRGR